MGAFIWPDDMGDLKHGAESLIWGGAQPLDLQRLWGSAPIETDNHQHPGVDGFLPRRARKVERVVELFYLLNTTVLADGTPTGNPAAGAFSNHQELIRRVGSPSTWGAESTSLELVDPLGQSWTAEVQMAVSPLGGERGGGVPVTLEIIIPAGEFTEAGS